MLECNSLFKQFMLVKPTRLAECASLCYRVMSRVKLCILSCIVLTVYVKT